jgi:hypothetical protein
MMRERVRQAGLSLLFVIAASSAQAQVGHVPAKSPYLDLDYHQEISFLFGYMSARHDEADNAPKSFFPALGLRYEATVAGPLALSVDVVGGTGSRNVLNPLNPAPTRFVGEQTNTEVAADFAAALNLTGHRSWHNLVPQVRGGVGLLHNGAADDSSGFAIGTRFAFSWGAGVKYVRPGSRLQIRADVTDRMFKIDYPDSFYRLASDNTSVLTGAAAKSFYTHHTYLTVGLSYLFAH